MQLCEKIVLGITICLLFIFDAKAQTNSRKQWDELESFLISPDDGSESITPLQDTDSILFPAPFIRQLTIENRPHYIFPTNPFLKGENEKNKAIRNSFSTHLKYSFQHYPDTYSGQIYGRSYQGVGLGRYFFENRKELGNPTVLYLFQGARISRVTTFLSLNYEWNIGLSFGWKPYDFKNNPNNHVIGSKINAYISTNLYLNWLLSEKFNLTTGIALTHFSNGNTKFPNNGLNTIGGKIGLAYNFIRKNQAPASDVQPLIPDFPRHISYDLVLFGSGSRTGVDFMDGRIASPEIYTVLGFYFAPMYNFGYRFRAGVSVDGTYNGSANIYTYDYFSVSEIKFFKPPPEKQLAIGISARAEYVMPYFTVSLGFGKNVIHDGGDMDIYYQSLALKIELTRKSFLNIGYSLRDFHNPNFLMLGLGFRLNNKYPVFYRRL